MWRAKATCGLLHAAICCNALGQAFSAPSARMPNPPGLSAELNPQYYSMGQGRAIQSEEQKNGRSISVNNSTGNIDVFGQVNGNLVVNIMTMGTRKGGAK